MNIYILGVVFSIAIYLWIYITDTKRSLSQNLLAVTMIIANLGYLCLSQSSDLPSAILATKMIYLGACYFPLLYLSTVCEVCLLNVKKWVVAALALLQTIVLFGAFTIGYNGMYYKEVQFQMVNGMGTLQKTYGPLHNLYLLSMVFSLGVAIVITVRSWRAKEMINHREVAVMMVLAVVSLGIYIVPRILGATIDYSPFSYLVLMAGVLLPIYDSNLYTVYENHDIIYEQINKDGFISFNRKMEYMGANDYALKILPELKDYKVGRRIATPGEELKGLMERLESFKDTVGKKDPHKHISHKQIAMGGRIFDLEIHTINNYRGRCAGFTLKIQDDTEHYRMLMLQEQYNDRLTEEVDQKTKHIREIQRKTILGMAQLVESRDLSTGGHIKRTSDVVAIFAKKLVGKGEGLNKHFLRLVIRSAPMHDIGKIGVDDAILRKQARFTDEEYEMMKKHSEIGGKMIHDILTDVEEEDFVRVAYNVAHYHHEKVDGSGYPCRLKGDEIPIEARIMALADVFDALVSKRCYKEAYTYDQAFSVIYRDMGKHFDAKLAAIFLQCRPELEEYYDKASGQ